MKPMREEELLWYRRYTDARALDRFGTGWPPREELEQTQGREARGDLYVQLLLTLNDDQLDLLETYLDAQNDERDYWLRRCFYLGFQVGKDET